MAKIDDIRFDDVLHSSHDEDELKVVSVDLPPPMHGVALDLRQRGQEKKLSDALHKLAAEDPSLKIEHNSQVNETVLRGMGELHLRLILERMQSRVRRRRRHAAAENPVPRDRKPQSRRPPSAQEANRRRRPIR